MDNKKKGLSYRDAGVDIGAATTAQKRVGELVRSTFTEGVLTEIGGFGGLFQFPEGMNKPVLVSSADGVGTKLKAAFMTGRHTTVGQCLVNHCVDDILCTGAKPLFFLDYIATGKLEGNVIGDIVEGLSKACAENGCALIGGETAEMPDFYSEGEYDMAGTIVGVVEKDNVLTGDNIVPGDILVGLPSTGCHTNGYSLVRKIFFDVLGLGVDDYVDELGCTVGEEMLKVHKSYAPILRDSIDAGYVKSLAHLTGGGFTDNIPRSLPDGCGARIKLGSWPVLPVFDFLQKSGNVDEMEMLHVFNMGIGMIAVVSPDDLPNMEKNLNQKNEEFYIVGEVVKGEKGVEYVR